MFYTKGEVRGGEIITKESKEIDQSQLTSDCWLIQFGGLDVCKTCEVRGTEDCGGGETLKRLRRQIK